MRYFVLADVHGYYKQMREALQKTGYDDYAGEKKVILLGDVFDRGKQAAETQAFVADLLKKDAAILVRGNHEDLLEELVDDLESYSWRGVEYSYHFSNGTVGTLSQLTGYTATKMNYDPERVRASFRHTPAYVYILPGTVDYFETKRYVFVHGWIPCDEYAYGAGGSLTRYLFNPYWRDASPEQWKRARWFNGMQAWHDGVTEPGKTIVCGHWNASFGHVFYEGKGEEFGENADFTPFIAEGIIAMDACTAQSGFCNCLAIDDEPIE